MVLSPWVFLHSRSMHSGLLFSMPMMHFGMPVYCSTALMPRMMSSLQFSISCVSLVSHTSHSEALISRVSTCCLGCSLTSVREACAAQTYQAALAHGCHKAGLIGHHRRLDGRVNGLLAIGLDDHRITGAAIGQTERLHRGHGAGNAGVDVGRNKAARLTDLGADEHFIALFNQSLGGAPMCWLIRMRTCAGRGIGTVCLQQLLCHAAYARQAPHVSACSTWNQIPILLELPPPRPCRRTGTGTASCLTYPLYHFSVGSQRQPRKNDGIS